MYDRMVKQLGAGHAKVQGGGAGARDGDEDE